MTPDDFEFQLHHEFDWRWNELILLKNTINSVRSESDQCNLRKSLVLTLYSHFEGFCIFSLGHYLLAVNAEQISCKNAVSSIVAGSWELVFRAMETGDEKCRIFSAPLPHDQKLHRHWRRRHFVEEIDKSFRDCL